MKPAPLQLNSYFLSALNITVTPKFDVKKASVYELNNLRNKIDISTNKEHPGIWQVHLALKYSPNANENVPYGFSIEIVGFFGVHPKWPKNQIETLVKINGPAILYSAAREIIVQITSRGPWGPMLLPAVNFID
jgi:preprotein translocase subunit SecB